MLQSAGKGRFEVMGNRYSKCTHIDREALLNTAYARFVAVGGLCYWLDNNAGKHKYIGGNRRDCAVCVEIRKF